MNFRYRGFSYLEVLIAIIIIATALIPAMDALYSGVMGSSIHQQRSVQHYKILEKIEDVLARPFSELQSEADLAVNTTDIITRYSDPAGTKFRRLVYIDRYDIDNADGDNNPFTGVENDLLWIKVETQNWSDAIETLTRR